MECFTETIMPSILDYSREELALWLEANGIRSYRAGQILRWIYLRQADTFDQMTDLSKGIRELLAGSFAIRRLHVQAVETSRDGSRKYLFRLGDGRHIESVLIPERSHLTLCVSSQVGCAQGCRFCLTARQGLVRSLTPGEIVSQVRDIQADLDDPSRLTNIVFMGMGEPLANYRNLIAAVAVLTDNEFGLRFANRRITVSTAGIVPRIGLLGRDTRVNLAVSLNASDDEARGRLMPVNRRYPLAELIQACADFPLPSGRRITFEYILMAGVNDSEKDAFRLARLLRSVKAKINLIPFNEYEGCAFRRPAEASILRFQEILLGRHYTTIIRESKGQDISAACGQLCAGKEGQEAAGAGPLPADPPKAANA